MDIHKKEMLIGAFMFGTSFGLFISNIVLSVKQHRNLIQLNRALDAQLETATFWEQILNEYPNGV